MDVSSVQKLCLYLISSAFQRCRSSEDLCRLSVVLSSSSTTPSVVRVSISDTGSGSCLEEFQDLKYTREDVGTEKWGICDKEIYHYHLNLRESVSARRLIRLPSNSKNGAKFSGTEVCMSISESIDILLAEIHSFFQKNVAAELVAEQRDVPGSRYENFFLANECNSSPFSDTNVERLKSGLEDYVLKHGKNLKNKCNSCFCNREYLKIGSGIACSMDSHRSSGLIVEAVIVISESAESTTPCFFRSCNTKTEVLYFKDFSPSAVSLSILNALMTGIDWKTYGLCLRSVGDEGGCALLEWENLPYAHIDMVLHCYHKKAKIPLAKHRAQHERSLIKRAVKFALDDLKEKYSEVLLSPHALKICSYAPDLARTIAGLILSSNDSEFQEECVLLLGLQNQDIEGKAIEDSIKDKIISVVQTNDKKPQKGKETAPFLFEDDYHQEEYIQNEEYEIGEDGFNSLEQ